MWMYKLLGSGLLLACGFLYPRFCARERREAREQLDALIALVAFVKRQIELFRLPMKEVLRRCDRELLSHFAKEQESLAALFGATRWLDREVERVAMELAESLGKGYYAEQLALCDAAMAELCSLRQEGEKGEQGRRRSESVLSLGAAVLAVILLF